MQRALTELKRLRGRITPQLYKTIKGQILAGDTAGALKGIERIKRKYGNN